MNFAELFGLLAFAAAGGSVFLSWVNARMLATIVHQTNSMQSEMLRMASEIAAAQGRRQGREDLLEEQSREKPLA